ncbi:MAG TPA: hypothetical protein DD730_09360 [Desulfosporosinus sp.]|nr:hypothetical protein [Desulfosporosinus sp.]
MAFLLLIQTVWMVAIHTADFPFPKLNFISFIFYFGLGIYTCDHFDQLKKGIGHLTPLYLITSLALTMGSSFYWLNHRLSLLCYTRILFYGCRNRLPFFKNFNLFVII